jgi:hypothetical protein
MKPTTNSIKLINFDMVIEAYILSPIRFKRSKKDIHTNKYNVD